MCEQICVNILSSEHLAWNLERVVYWAWKLNLVFYCFKPNKPIKLTAKNRTAIGGKTDPMRYVSVLIMRKPILIGSVINLEKNWAYRTTHTPSHIREPTIILEAVASYDLGIWHAFFGLPRSNNDINVLERSNIFSELAKGRAPAINYSINDNDYTMGYYLADGIYSKWSTFVKIISAPQGEKRKLFAKAQECIGRM